MAPPEVWPQLRWDLLSVKHCLAYHQEEIGCVEWYEFDVHVPPNLSIHMPPTPLTPEEGEWVEAKMHVYCT